MRLLRAPSRADFARIAAPRALLELAIAMAVVAAFVAEAGHRHNDVVLVAKLLAWVRVCMGGAAHAGMCARACGHGARRLC